MNLSFKTLEVDGGLSNPVVLAAMGIWLAMLLVLLVPLATYLGRRNALRRGGLSACVVALLLVVPTQFARVVIGTWLYQIRNPAIISVGFWGGVSPLLVPALVAVCWFLVYRKSQVAVA